jgi:hypothetical protein
MARRGPTLVLYRFEFGKDLYGRKGFIQDPDGRVQVYIEDPLVKFAELRGSDLLSTSDLRRYFKCSARTLYRWIAEQGLEPSVRVGRDLYFEKRAVVRWEKTHRPKRGRPTK